MASVTTSIYYDLIGRDRGAKSAIDGTSKAADKAGKSFNKAGDMARDMGDSLKSAIPIAAGLTLGVAGLSEAWDATIGGAMEAEGSLNKLQGQLGLTEKAATKAGAVSAKIYGEAWGESLDDVNQTVRAVGTNLTDLENVSKRELTRMVRDAQVLADTYDLDVNQATRAAGQLMRTGLAKDATHAFNLITKGFQAGADRSEDFLDTLNEYAPQFQKLGISGPYAINLISAAMKAGARDSDVAADAIKEFSIRAIDGTDGTVAGFEAAGLEADRMAAKIAKGGPTAEKAFRQTLRAIVSIEDPIKRDAAGVALFGTQWEDLGPTVMEAMSQATGGVDGLRGATKRLSETVGAGVASRFQAIQRRMEDWLLSIGKAAMPALEKLADVIEAKVVPAIQRWITWFSGPGKYRIAETFLDITIAGLDFAESFLGWLAGTGKATIAWAGRILDAMTIALGWSPVWGDVLRKAQEKFHEFEGSVDKDLNHARNQVHKWNTSAKNMRTEVRLKAHIANLTANLDRAKRRLRDKDLTKTRTARIGADITALRRQIARARFYLTGIPDELIMVNIRAKVDNQLRGRYGYASGTPSAKSGVALVGEEGPELVRLRGGERIWTAQQTKRMMSGSRPSLAAAGGAGNGDTHFHFPNYLGSRSELVRELRNLVRTRNLLQGA